jgi:hypothetical protein
MGFWGIFEGFLGALGIFYYKFLRNQGRNRCKTNVNFQLFNHCFVQNGTIHEKKLNLFFCFCCCSILWEKKRLRFLTFLMEYHSGSSKLLFSLVIFVIFEVKFVCIFYNSLQFFSNGLKYFF